MSRGGVILVRDSPAAGSGRAGSLEASGCPWGYHQEGGTGFVRFPGDPAPGPGTGTTSMSPQDGHLVLFPAFSSWVWNRLPQLQVAMIIESSIRHRVARRMGRAILGMAIGPLSGSGTSEIAAP